MELETMDIRIEREEEGFGLGKFEGAWENENDGES